MKIVLATSEAVPFAKTGGLADVCGALPMELARLGHQVTLFMPAYRCVLNGDFDLEPTGVQLSIPIGRKNVTGQLLVGRFPSQNPATNHVPAAANEPVVYFIQQDDYFDRDGLYQERGEDYRDNCERFVFFSRAVLEAIRLLQIDVDVIHCNDWQTGLIPAYLQIEYRSLPRFQNVTTLLTVHNLSYQGTFWHWDMLLTGLDWKYFNWHQMEFFGNLNLMKTGLVFADRINTVSPRYAEEIQSIPLGCGLEGVLQQRRKELTGILNGVDYQQWNPETDSHLKAKYSLKNRPGVVSAKAANKAALQAALGLPQSPRTPLIAFVGRLAEQKGIDLITGAMQEWAPHRDAQWVLLGTGEAKYQELIANIAQRHPQRVAARFEFSESLAHQIEAAADIFLMPSRFEPCGLSQLYSLKYGTVPVVRATGGLSDTIVDANDETLTSNRANGFSFREYSTLAFSETLSRAVALYEQPVRWERLVANGMSQDWSWLRSAIQYAELYEQLMLSASRGVSSPA
ncbi:MAG: glycogen synthase GlgA [Planctomycetota bacterium]|nr:glycogen synthase GlgA [Planctomycetota bacterium]